MKLIQLSILLSGLIIISCSTSTSDGSEQASNETKIDTVAAVCVWDNISVREIPSSDGKWLTSISIGEALDYLGVDSLDLKEGKRTYAQVKLADGTIGWSLKDFIIPNGKVAVFLEENTIYKRPDLLTKSDKTFSQMDIVAIKTNQDGWLEIVGRRKGADWIETGWVKGDNLSQDPIDVAVAKFGAQALKENDESSRIEKINEIIDNSDFSNSKFIPVLQEMLDAQTEEIEEEMMSADSVASEA